MNNAELIVGMLERAGVRWVFGVPSGPVLPLIEALRRSTGVDYVLTASETSAGFMAEAVGRLTGVPGVCVSTVGPGATNLATGVGGAWLDRSPVLAITCTYARAKLGRRTQMLIDHQALFAPLTKGSARLGDGPEDGPKDGLEERGVAEGIAWALTLAVTEPPGPVHLELPEDVALAEASSAEGRRPRPEHAGAARQPAPPADAAAEVRRLLEAAERPLVVAGLTFTRSAAPGRLLRFIETQRLPFVTTMHAKGFLPESHPACLGVMGRARRTDVQRMIDRADLLIAVGFDPVEIDYEEWAGRTPVVHLSTEPVQPGTDANVVYEGVGGLDATLDALAALDPVPNRWDAAEWSAHREALASALRPPTASMAAYHVIDVLRDVLPADAILTYDVGAHTHQIAAQWSTDLPHTAVSTNGWSSMGYGMPAAYAAKLAHPERTVLALIGDGCFQMTVGELATAARLGLEVPTVVLNDGWLGLMKVKQERLGYGSSAALLGGAPELPEPPAHYFGVPVRGVRDEAALRSALEWALDRDGPSVIEAFIDVGPYSETVFDQ